MCWEPEVCAALEVVCNGVNPGVTGLDTWLWATGEQAHFWTTTGIGHAARRVWAQDATLDDAGDVTGWGPEYILETQTWPCMRQAAWSARIIAWHWTLEGPKTLTAASGRAGFQPALDGDGREASARLLPETKGRYTAHLQTTWQADWGPAVRFTQTHPPIDYLIGEIRSQLLPNQP